MSAQVSASPGWRIACVRVPDFVLAVALRAFPQGVDEPTVLVRETGQKAWVHAANDAAQAIGIRPKQSASRARTRWEGLHCLPWDEAAFEAAERALIERLHDASPLVVPAEGEQGVFWVDARGMRFFGGEPGLLERLMGLMVSEGYGQARVAIADTAVAARAAARCAPEASVIVPPGEDQQFLGQLPVEALELSADLLATLSGLGVQTVAALRKVPRRALVERFGAAAREAIERATAWDLRRPEGAPPPTLPKATLALEQPVAQSGRLIFALRGLVETLASRLIASGLSATRLSLCLRLDDHSESAQTLDPARPQHHPRPIFELLRERLDRWEVDSPVVEVTLEVVCAQPAVAEQIHLGATQWSPQALEGVLNRLQGRYGQAVVMVPEPVDAHQPEEAGVWKPVTEVPLGALAWSPQPAKARFGQTDPEAAHRILPVPEPIAVRENREGQPVAAQWGGRWYRARASAPERLSGAWWTDCPFAREDFRLQLTDGAVLWVSRTGEGWALRGWLD